MLEWFIFIYLIETTKLVVKLPQPYQSKELCESALHSFLLPHRTDSGTEAYAICQQPGEDKIS